MSSIKNVFANETSHVSVDARLVKRVHTYLQAFIHRNADYTAFFGGALMGVHTVRFTKTDQNAWFDDVLEVDDVSVKEKVLSLPHIDPNHVRANDPMNLSCIWLLHAISNSNKLSSKQREQGMIDTLMILQAKFLTSIMAHNFKYQADRSVAEATYAALSKKYALKAHGSWQALLLARSKDIISKKSIHLATFQRFNDDEAIAYMITDIQGRLREIVKKMLKVFYQIRDDDAKAITTSGVINLDGEKTIRNKERNATTYIRYIHSVIPNKASFIRDELVSVVTDIMHTMPEKLFRQALDYMSDNYGVKGEKEIQPLVDEVLLHAFDFLSKNRASLRANDIAGIVTRLRAVYMSSRSTDPAVMKMRELAESISGKAVDSKNSSVIASVRTGLLVYIVLRTFTMNHYS